jgi:uncharacterized protein (TIGR02246 family)
MPVPRFAAALLLTLTALMPCAATATDAADAALLDLVQRHLTAQRTYDVPALAATTSDDFIEVSPLGEVDPRQKMLGFYAVPSTTPAPTVQLQETMVRVYGDSAIVVAKLAYTMTANGQSREMAMRGTYVAHKTDGVWKLVSTHYNGIRPPKTPS